jgi:type 1 glutamine amidotransferase
MAGHDHDYARLSLLGYLQEAGVRANVANDFSDIGRWLDISRLLITYVAGPYPNDEQNEYLKRWLASGGRWLGLHGTAGGRAVREGDSRRRRMMKTAHHETLGGFFINHPPVRRFSVDVHEDGILTRDMPAAFETIDEPYMIEVRDPASSKVLLTAPLGPDTSPEGFGFIYDADTALQEDGQTRVLGYTRTVGAGAVTYIALGHCHSPGSNSQPFVDTNVDPEGKTPAVLRTTWEAPAFQTLIRNAIEWGMGKD